MFGYGGGGDYAEWVNTYVQIDRGVGERKMPPFNVWKSRTYVCLSPRAKIRVAAKAEGGVSVLL